TDAARGDPRPQGARHAAGCIGQCPLRFTTASRRRPGGSAVFSWVGTQFSSVLNNYVLGVVSALMTAIAPLALTVTTLWILLFGWAVLRNDVPETLPSFLWR